MTLWISGPSINQSKQMYIVPICCSWIRGRLVNSDCTGCFMPLQSFVSLVLSNLTARVMIDQLSQPTVLQDFVVHYCFCLSIHLTQCAGYNGVFPWVWWCTVCRFGRRWSSTSSCVREWAWLLLVRVAAARQRCGRISRMHLLNVAKLSKLTSWIPKPCQELR